MNKDAMLNITGYTAATVRAWAAGKAVLSWLQQSSMGDKSGEYGGSKSRRTWRRA